MLLVSQSCNSNNNSICGSSRISSGINSGSNNKWW